MFLEGGEKLIFPSVLFLLNKIFFLFFYFGRSVNAIAPDATVWVMSVNRLVVKLFRNRIPMIMSLFCFCILGISWCTRS